MKLYHASPHEDINAVMAYPCPRGVCEHLGFSEDHVCFSTVPPDGIGEWMFAVDVPMHTIAPYSYQDVFRERNVRHYALPLDLVWSLIDEGKIRLTTYEMVTGRPWNQWKVVLADATGQIGLSDYWGLIWMSRPGIAGATVVERATDGAPEYLAVEVTTSDDFDPYQDYIIVERHWMREQVGSDPRPAWELELLAGAPPQWMVFPWAWRQWVTNDEVLRSAAGYIVQQIPSARADVDFALRRDSRANQARAWRYVASFVSSTLARQQGIPVDLGTLSGHTHTAVQAMPMRIAMRMGRWTGVEWTPPCKMPEFEDPDRSGRILLANQYGVYPTQGPGVDYSPKDWVRSEHLDTLSDVEG